MKRIPIITTLLAAAWMILSPVSAISQEDLSAKEIVRIADEKNRGETMKGEMSMTIVRPKWERTISMKSWSKGDKYFLIYITAPAKEKGQVFLKVDKEMWNYVPTISRMIKIPPSMMMQSWMGSDFTNDDLVKQSSIVTDYEHSLIGEETIRDEACYQIELIPKEDAAVVWGKIISWITRDDYLLWKSEYYDEDGYLQNTEYAYDIKSFGDRELPSRIEMVPAEKEGQKTIITIEEAVYNEPIDDSFFSKQNMTRVR
ncbi:MAG: outer membrane lipoprotein-sorting protein [bacterium]|jgi:outer membrane lipoprotein-sorting protein